jgi:hypothetical protein
VSGTVCLDEEGRQYILGLVPAPSAQSTTGGLVSAPVQVRERLREPEAFLSRTDLRELGLERRAVDAVFRALPIVALPGYSRPLVRVADYLALIENSTYRDDRVRP